jgi:hypothetical protein
MAQAVQEPDVQHFEHPQKERGRNTKRSFMNLITTLHDRRSLGPWTIICVLALVYFLSPHLPSGIREYLSAIVH